MKMLVNVVVVLFVVVAAGALPSGQPTSCNQLECSHSCVEKGEWNFICTCPDGLVLEADKRTCRVTNPQKGSKEFVITRYSFNDAFSRASTPVSILGVDSTVTSLAVDWVGGRLYWVCDQRSTLESATTDGTARKTILTLEDSPEFKDVVVDPHAGNVFWLSTKGIYSSDLSGDTVKTLNTTTALVKPEHLSLDTKKQVIYVIGNQGNGDKAVVRYHYDGTQEGSAFTLQGHKGSEVFGFGVVGNQVFWQSNQNGENMYKSEIPSSSGTVNVNATLVEEIDQIVYGMKIVHPDVQKTAKAKKVLA